MASSVYVFNGAPVSMSMNINNGDTLLQVSAADKSSGWTPGTPDNNPSFSGNSNPPKGEFGYGANYCTITPATGGGAVTVTVNVPGSVNPASDLQLYLFYKDTTHSTWVLLADGVPVSGNISL